MTDLQQHLTTPQETETQPTKTRFGFWQGATVFTLGVYVLVLLSILSIMIFERFQQAGQPRQPLSGDVAANLAVEQADRILNLLETLFGVIGVILPLALGVIVYLYQQGNTNQKLSEKALEANKRTIRNLSENARQSAQTVRELQGKVAQALKELEESEKRDKARDDESRRLQELVASQQATAAEQSNRLEDLLNETYGLQQQWVIMQKLLDIRRWTAEIRTDDMETLRLSLESLQQYTFPDYDEDNGHHNQYQSIIRREAVRALTTLRDSPGYTRYRDEVIGHLKSLMENRDDDLIVLLEAQYVLSVIAPKPRSPRKPKTDDPTALAQGD